MLEVFGEYLTGLYYVFSNLENETKSVLSIIGIVIVFILLVRLYGWLKGKDYGPSKYEPTGPHTISGRYPDPADPADPGYPYRDN